MPPGARRLSSAARTSASGRTPATASVQPSCASARAMPKPIPRVPPVTSAVLLMHRPEKRQVGIAGGQAFHVQGGFPEMIVAPLARLAAPRAGARRHMIPAVGPVIHRMQQQALVRGVDAQIGLTAQRIENLEARLRVT